ncbi:hypothetical protein [Mesorhizobium australafricanum]|uniref:Uncharacterized protein n=1 Tax=Mesorhizobium australafricanum TaxID=3072311 RepID=A0ABU4X0E2_9HYPH|nr:MULTISPECIES: hypothetical protein [unclassified Mesorhizobium]MDX8440963.1 hypothetical protein [Mesorhizobium sp. VK3E]MDX8455945.1 hypothetical protein [Mesorhizobium sp. VK9D]
MADEGLIGQIGKAVGPVRKNRRLTTSGLDLPSKTHESFVNPSWKSPMAAGLMHVAEAPERFWDLPKTRT